MNLTQEYILTEDLQKQVYHQPESGSGYRIARVRTKDGVWFDNVVVVGGYRINGIYGYMRMPFRVQDVVEIQVTHFQKDQEFDPEKWFFIEP